MWLNSEALDFVDITKASDYVFGKTKEGYGLRLQDTRFLSAPYFIGKILKMVKNIEV